MNLAASSTPLWSEVAPGVLGFLVVAGMAVVLFFLLRSLNKQLHKVAGGPRWQEEAHQPQPPAEPGQPAQPTDFQPNGKHPR
jgi:hypothetical protein